MAVVQATAWNKSGAGSTTTMAGPAACHCHDEPLALSRVGNEQCTASGGAGTNALLRTVGHEGKAVATYTTAGGTPMITGYLGCFNAAAVATISCGSMSSHL